MTAIKIIFILSYEIFFKTLPIMKNGKMHKKTCELILLYNTH